MTSVKFVVGAEGNGCNHTSQKINFNPSYVYMSRDAKVHFLATGTCEIKHFRF